MDASASRALPQEAQLSVEEECCWVCLEAHSARQPLASVCACPRKVHRKCLARWQLQCAGKTEEKHCRFCKQVLPDWQPALQPKAPLSVSSAAPLVCIKYGAQSYQFTMLPGEEGKRIFQRNVCAALGLPEGHNFEVKFECKEPVSGSQLELQGLSAYDAAAFCAYASAVKRQTENGGAESRHQSSSTVGQRPCRDK